MHVPAGHRGNHRLRVRGVILRRENRLVEARNNKIERGQHWPGTVDFTLRIFDVGFDTAQDPHAINDTRPNTHINKVPGVRRVGHIRAVIGDSKEFDAFTFRFGNIVMQRAISMRAGNSVHVQVNGIHHILLYRVSAKNSRKPGLLLAKTRQKPGLWG